MHDRLGLSWDGDVNVVDLLITETSVMAIYILTSKLRIDPIIINSIIIILAIIILEICWHAHILIQSAS